MKKMLVFLFFFLLNYSVYSDDNSTIVTWPLPTTQPPSPPRALPPPSQDFSNISYFQKFSPKAFEIIQIYLPRSNPRFDIIPPFNPEQYVNEEYRPAWEELYRESVTNNAYAYSRGIQIMYPKIALSTIASTNSIPMFVDVYTQFLETNQDENQEKQKEILGILLKINAPEALDTVFSLLDLTENKTGVKSALTLREAVLENLEQALQKRDKLTNYQNFNLSANNKTLLEKVRQKEP